MSWTDGLSDFEEMLPIFGVIGVVIFIFVAGYTFITHNQIIKHGATATVQQIGTCRDGKCAVKVISSDDGKVYERVTGSTVFVGDVVKCNISECYKD